MRQQSAIRLGCQLTVWFGIVNLKDCPDILHITVSQRIDGERVHCVRVVAMEFGRSVCRSGVEDCRDKRGSSVDVASGKNVYLFLKKLLDD